MNARHLAGIAIFCCTSGVLGGRGAQAQSASSVRFVRLLLVRESRQILVDEAAIARQDQEIRILNRLKTSTPLTARAARQLDREVASIQRTIVLLQSRIDETTQRLLALRNQLVGSPSPYSQQAAHNAAIINSLASRGRFGVPPATPISGG